MHRPPRTGRKFGLLRQLLERDPVPGWPALHPLRHSLRCAACGSECAACLAHPPAFERTRAILRYDEVSRAPILALKHADRLDLVPGFGQWLEQAGRDLIAGSDLIVPVPLQRLRLWRRRYNQAAERNVLGAFQVPERRRVARKHVLLVDDVVTTGATAEAASRALRRADAVRVQILALARVVRAAEIPI